MFFDEYLVFDVKIQMYDEGVNPLSFFVRRLCNTRNKKNETSSHP